jgi:hypothetical protein
MSCDPNLMLLANQYDSEKIMKEYDILHKLEKQKNYSLKNEDKKNYHLAKFLYQNFDQMDGIEMKELAMKCLTENELKSILLNFELTYYKEKPQKYLSLEEFLIKAQMILNRYQGKAGGFLLEDTEWEVYRPHDSNQKYDLMENEILLVNSIDVTDYDDSETEKYIKKLVNRLKSIAENIKIDMRYKNSEKDKIIYILLWVKDKTLDIEVTDIGL